jgi:hypothetical protein
MYLLVRLKDSTTAAARWWEVGERGGQLAQRPCCGCSERRREGDWDWGSDDGVVQALHEPVLVGQEVDAGKEDGGVDAHGDAADLAEGRVAKADEGVVDDEVGECRLL